VGAIECVERLFCALKPCLMVLVMLIQPLVFLQVVADLPFQLGALLL